MLASAATWWHKMAAAGAEWGHAPSRRCVARPVLCSFGLNGSCAAGYFPRTVLVTFTRPIWLYSFWKLAECLRSREEALVGDNLSGCNLYTWMHLNVNPLLCFFQILHTVIGIFLHYDLTSGLFVAPRNRLPSLDISAPVAYRAVDFRAAHIKVMSTSLTPGTEQNLSLQTSCAQNAQFNHCRGQTNYSSI